MAKESERTYLMKQNFMTLHQAGYNITEIAEKYKLSKFTVYKHLQEIADANKVNRESLLQVVRTPTERQFRKEENRVRINVEELRQGFKEADIVIGNLLAQIDTIIKEDQLCNQ